MDHEQALEIVSRYIKNPQMVKHMLATEAVMRALARQFGEDEDRWGLVGLLHDADAEIAISGEQELVASKVTGTGPAPAGKHSMMPAQGLLVPKLTQNRLDEESAAAIASHNPYTGFRPKSRMGWALYAADPFCERSKPGTNSSVLGVRRDARGVYRNRFGSDEGDCRRYWSLVMWFEL
jgi:predicted hydrolase (HD superfamily)